MGKNVLWHLRNLHTEAELRERCLHAQPWVMLSETHFTRGSQLPVLTIHTNALTSLRD